MKTSTLKITALFLCLIMLFSVSFSSLAASFEEENVIVGPDSWTQNQLNIAARGDYMYDLTWVCQKTVTAHSYSYYYTYYAGNTYRMPYGQGSTSYYIGYGVSPEGFLQAAADVNSIFYTQKSYVSSWYSTYYIQDCSGYVSWCWGLTAKQSTRSLANVSSYIGPITTSNIRNKLQLGDAINRYDYHVVLVTDIFYDGNGNMTGVEITEQTIPETTRTVYTPEELASAYSNYDGIYRYYGTVPAAPSSTTNKLENNDPVDMGKDFYARISNPSINKYFTDESNQVWARDFTGEKEQIWHFMRQANGAYLIGNSGTSKFLSVKDSQYVNGTRLVTGNVTYEANQKFYIYYLYNNFYMMPQGRDMTVDVDCSLFHTQICGTDTGNGKDEASFKARSLNLEIINIHDGTREVADLGESFQATIKNSASGKYVTANGASLVAADKNGLDTQKWNFKRLANGAYTIVSQSENLAIDVTHTRLEEGTAVNMYDYTGLNAQTFFLIKKDGSYYIKPTYTLNSLSMNSSSLTFTIESTSDDTAKLSAQKFEIDVVGNTSTELILKDGSAYTENGEKVSGIKAGQTAEEVLANFKNESAVILDADGNALDASAKVGTAAKIALIVDGKTLDSIEVVVKGDVNGDGVIDGTDYLRIKTAFLGTLTLNGSYLDAADVDGNGIVDSTDYIRVKGHFVGSFDIYA